MSSEIFELPYLNLASMEESFKDLDANVLEDLLQNDYK